MTNRESEIKAFQRRLKDVGLYSGAIDGDFGPGTLSAALKACESLATVTPIDDPKSPIEVWTMSGVLAKLVPLVKSFEGFRSESYWDATGKVWTIGYGTTRYPSGQAVQRGELCSVDQAVGYMMHDLQKLHMTAVENMVTVPMTDGMFAALTSFAYNVGNGNLKSSTLLTLLNSGASKDTVADQFGRWNKSGGIVLAGLTKRRAAEAKCFLS